MAIWFGALNGLVRVGTVGRAHQQWLGGCSSLVIALLSLMSHLAFAEDSGPLVGDLKFADPRLDTCIKTYAAEQGYRSAADVKEVPCFGLGIQSLNGIEALTEALVVDVSVNQIADFTPLYSLAAKIAYIDIHANRILCSDMLVLSRVLNRAFRVGFDTANCIAETGGSPGPETEPQQPSGRVPPTLPQPLPPPPPGVPSYESIRGLVAANCGGCHQGGQHRGGVALDTEQLLVINAGEILESLDEGEMPPGNPSWRYSEEAKLLSAYLRGNRRGGDDFMKGAERDSL